MRDTMGLILLDQGADPADFTEDEWASALAALGAAKDSGQMDVDKLMTGTPRSERNKIAIVRRLIQENSDQHKGAPEHVVMQRAEEKGITETELKDIMRKMKQAGEVYDPGGGHIKLVGGD